MKKIIIVFAVNMFIVNFSQAQSCTQILDNVKNATRIIANGNTTAEAQKTLEVALYKMAMATQCPNMMDDYEKFMAQMNEIKAKPTGAVTVDPNYLDEKKKREDAFFNQNLNLKTGGELSGGTYQPNGNNNSPTSQGNSTMQGDGYAELPFEDGNNNANKKSSYTTTGSSNNFSTSNTGSNQTENAFTRGANSQASYNSFTRGYENFASEVDKAFKSGKDVNSYVNQANQLKRDAENGTISYAAAEAGIANIQIKMKANDTLTLSKTDNNFQAIEPSKNIDKKGNLESFNKRFEIFAQNVEIAFNSGKYVVDIVNEANVLRKNAENSMISYPAAENRLEELEKKLKLAKERLPEKANVKISTTIKKVDTESSNPFYTSFQDFKANATKKELNPHGYIVQFQDETTKIEIAAYLEHVLTYNEVYSTIFIWYVDKKFSRFTISISGYEDSKIPMVKNLLVKSGATNFKVDVDGSLSFQYNLK